ncbi:MAG: 2-C-methyl-D-erythritol 4-phosphate cytidylyltransferase [Pyrinomonadaceae bacterium]|jgi:2-C-methyl-D-erythritol 4-phosphate cytidylyltransferase
MNIAVIVAAGNSRRFGAKTPKQFLEILGKPVIVHTLLRFEICSAIDEVILVLASDEIANLSAVLEKYNLKKLKKIVAGGDIRSQSVLNGLRAIDQPDIKIVAVHDGARPMVSVAEITEVVAKAEEIGAACLVADVTDTIKEVVDGKITNTINRRRLKRALTPQAFRYEILKRAFAENIGDENATDECFLVEKLGFEIAVVEGSAKNIKITYPEDQMIAEFFLREKEN